MRDMGPFPKYSNKLQNFLIAKLTRFMVLQLGKKKISHIRKEVSSIMRCVITSYFDCHHSDKDRMFFIHVFKKGCKLVKQTFTK